MSLGVVYNVFESVDVIALIRGGVYDDLSLTVGEVLKKRSPVCCNTAPFFSFLLIVIFFLSLLVGANKASVCTFLLTSSRTSLASTPAPSMMGWIPFLTQSANPASTV